MVEGLAQLIELQVLDAALAKAESDLGKLPDARAACAAKREAAEARTLEATEGLAAAEGTQRAAETEMQDKEALLAKLDLQQHQVKSNDAYTALLREMEEAKEAISVAETQILEAMETIESARAVLAGVENEVATLVEHVAAEEAGIDTREKDLGAGCERLRSQRQAVQDQVPPDLALQYERIAKRCTPAVAHVIKEICQGCRMNIPPQLHIELMNATTVHLCPNCRRILIPEGQGN